jgi:hypothetical protein
VTGDTWDRMAPPPVWDITGDLDGFAVRFHGDVVARAPTFDQARARYNGLRAQAAMAMESLRHALEQEQAR